MCKHGHMYSFSYTYTHLSHFLLEYYCVKFVLKFAPEEDKISSSMKQLEIQALMMVCCPCNFGSSVQSGKKHLG